MLKPSFLTLTLISLLRLAATAQDTTWFDNNWKITTTHPYYFRTKVRTDSGWQATDHYPGGKPQMIGLFADDSLKIKEGVCRWFSLDGTVSHLVTYRANKADGFQQSYYENGRPKLQGTAKDKDREGEWTVFFPSGKVAGKAQYLAGKRISTMLYHEDGTRNTKDTIFERDSEYPGGTARFDYFLNKKLRYPDSAVIHEIEGMVLVRFHVSKTGKVSDLIIEQSANPWLDAEALRVLKLMEDWKPAIVAGTPVESFHLQPVIFSLTGS